MSSHPASRSTRRVWRGLRMVFVASGIVAVIWGGWRALLLRQSLLQDPGLRAGWILKAARLLPVTR